MRICFFGESYVSGTGDPTYQGWVGRLCQMARARGYDITAYNCGIRGASSALMERTWQREAETRLTGIDKAAAVFSFGTNDSWIENGAPLIEADRQMDNTRAILRAAKSRWPTLMVGPPGLAAYTPGTLRETDHRARCATMQKICDDEAVPYFDTLAVFSSFKHWSGEAIKNDGAHPGAGGYTEMAAVIDAWGRWRALLDTLRA